MQSGLPQLAYRASDRFRHELSIARFVSHDRVPTQPNVGGPAVVLQHQCLEASLLPEVVIRGIADKVVSSLLPYASLYGVDDHGHAPMKLASHLDRKRIPFHHSSRGGGLHWFSVGAQRAFVRC